MSTLYRCTVLRNNVRRGKCVGKNGHENCPANIRIETTHVPYMRQTSPVAKRGNLYPYVTANCGYGV